MTPEAVNAYFTPLDYFLYLAMVLVILIAYSQWKWANVCKRNVQVLVVRADGHGDYELAPQDGGSVTLKNPNTGTARLWPINELSTIDVPYPGVGFVPAFMQKNIRMVVVDEKDWEPMINRGPNLTMVASPDVRGKLVEIARQITEIKVRDALTDLVEDLSTAPTRELIGNPAILGNLMVEKITEAVLTINKEVLDTMSGLAKRLNNIVSPTQLYIVGGVILVVLVFVVYQIMPITSAIGEMADKLDAISRSLGIP